MPNSVMVEAPFLSSPLCDERPDAPPFVMSVWMPLGDSLEAPWDPFGAFGAHLLSLFGVSFWGVRFCLDFGPQHGAKIHDFRGVSDVREVW